jgi:hypothetical protein
MKLPSGELLAACAYWLTGSQTHYGDPWTVALDSEGAALPGCCPQGMALFGQVPVEPACKDDLESGAFNLTYLGEVG